MQVCFERKTRLSSTFAYYVALSCLSVVPRLYSSVEPHTFFQATTWWMLVSRVELWLVLALILFIYIGVLFIIISSRLLTPGKWRVYYYHSARKLDQNLSRPKESTMETFYWKEIREEILTM